MERFSDKLKSAFDKHAPLVKRNIVVRPNTQWHSDELRNVKKDVRRAEKKWRKSKLICDRKNFVQTRNRLNRLRVHEKKNYLMTKIKEKKDTNSKSFFKEINGLLVRSDPSENIPSSNSKHVLSEKFADFFNDKIDKIRCELDSHVDVTSNSTPSKPPLVTIENFTPTCASEIVCILNKMPNKSCSLDAIPTWVIKDCAEHLAPCISLIVNASLESADMPDILKHAIIKPLKKKKSLDKNILKNYRPVSNLSFISKIIEKVVFLRLNEHVENTQGVFQNCNLLTDKNTVRKQRF